MAEKKPTFDDKLFRWLYNNAFYEEDVGDNEFYDEDIMNLIKGSKSYDEARNRIIDKIQKDGNYGFLSSAVDAYNDMFGNSENGETYSVDKLTALDNMKKVPLNVEALEVEDVLGRVAEIANALGYDVKNGGSEKLLDDIFNQEYDNKKFMNNQELNKYLVGKKLEKSLSSLDSTRNLYKALGFTPSEDDSNDYVIGKITDLVGRARGITDRSKQNKVGKAVGDFLFSYIGEKSDKGVSPNAVDAIFDTAMLVGPGTAGKSSKVEKLSGIGKALGNNSFLKASGPAAVGALLNPILTRAHDMAEAPLNKSVYSNEGESNEISERESPFDDKNTRLSTIGDEYKDALNVILGASVFGGPIKKFAKSNLAKNIELKIKNGLDGLFGKNNSGKIKKLQKEVNELTTETNKLDADLGDYYKRDGKKKYVENKNTGIGHKNYQDVEQGIVDNNLLIEEKQREIERLKKEQQKPSNAFDAIANAIITKFTLNPREREIEK